METDKKEEVINGAPQVENGNSQDNLSIKEEKEIAGGRSGICNIGNTCYMSTGLQCLSHIPDLTKLFLSNDYYSMLNRDNCMGSGGIVAESFAALLKQLWEKEKFPVNPTYFKKAFQGYDNQFIGVDQHDSQEFFAKLVDVLHEDLNLIKKKPYIETPVYTHYDKAQGEEMWNIFLQRNQSKIVDCLYGMTCNQIQCSECHEMRMRYEPNNVIMLPMPSEKFKITINVLSKRDIEKEYDEEAEDLRRANEAKLSEKSHNRKIPFRAFKLQYIETDYNFYGMCKELYEEAAKVLDLSVDMLDLFIECKFNGSQAMLIKPDCPQSSLSQYIELGGYLICQIRPCPTMEPILIRHSYLLFYYDYKPSFSNMNEYASFITYYDPEDSVDTFLSSLSPFFTPKFKRLQTKFMKRVEDVFTDLVDHTLHPEKYIPKEEEKTEEVPEQKTKITTFFKKEEEKVGEEDVKKDYFEGVEDLNSEEDEDFEEDDLSEESHSCGETPNENSIPQENDGETPNENPIPQETHGETPNEKENSDSEDDSYPQVDESSEIDSDIMVEDEMILEDMCDEHRKRDCCEDDCCCCDNSKKRCLQIPYLTAEEYSTWKEVGCHFPVVFSTYASFGPHDALPEYFINNIVLEKHGSIPCKEFFKQYETIPSISIIIDAEKGSILEQYKRLKEGTEEEEEDVNLALDEIFEVFDIKTLSLKHCKSKSWKLKHNVSTDVSINKCFELFMDKGNNDPNSLWFCPKCQKDVIASSVSNIWKAPQYLIIQLSRFEYVTNHQLGGTAVSFDNRKRKMETKVVFPIKDLDITSYMHKDAIQEEETYKYDLIAVCNHSGNVDCGHYIALCKDDNDDTPKWFKYDDDYVTPLKEKEICSADAYMLIYQRQDVKCSTKDVMNLVHEQLKKE